LLTDVHIRLVVVIRCISATKQEERERELEKKLKKPPSFLESLNNSLEAVDELSSIEDGFFDTDASIDKYDSPS